MSGAILEYRTGLPHSDTLYNINICPYAWKGVLCPRVGCPLLHQKKPVVQEIAEKPKAKPCLHFLSGSCNFGAACRNSHETIVVPPPVPPSRPSAMHIMPFVPMVGMPFPLPPPPRPTGGLLQPLLEPPLPPRPPQPPTRPSLKPGDASSLPNFGPPMPLPPTPSPSMPLPPTLAPSMPLPPTLAPSMPHPPPSPSMPFHPNPMPLRMAPAMPVPPSPAPSLPLPPSPSLVVPLLVSAPSMPVPPTTPSLPPTTLSRPAILPTPPAYIAPSSLLGPAASSLPASNSTSVIMSEAPKWAEPDDFVWVEATTTPWAVVVENFETALRGAVTGKLTVKVTDGVSKLKHAKAGRQKPDKRVGPLLLWRMQNMEKIAETWDSARAVEWTAELAKLRYLPDEQSTSALPVPSPQSTSIVSPVVTSPSSQGSLLTSSYSVLPSTTTESGASSCGPSLSFPLPSFSSVALSASISATSPSNRSSTASAANDSSSFFKRASTEAENTLADKDVDVANVSAILSSDPALTGSTSSVQRVSRLQRSTHSSSSRDASSSSTTPRASDKSSSSDKNDQARSLDKNEQTRDSDKSEQTRSSDKNEQARGSSDKIEQTRGSDKDEKIPSSTKTSSASNTSDSSTRERNTSRKVAVSKSKSSSTSESNSKDGNTDRRVVSTSRTLSPKRSGRDVRDLSPSSRGRRDVRDLSPTSKRSRDVRDLQAASSPKRRAESQGQKAVPAPRNPSPLRTSPRPHTPPKSTRLPRTPPKQARSIADEILKATALSASVSVASTPLSGTSSAPHSSSESSRTRERLSDSRRVESRSSTKQSVPTSSRTRSATDKTSSSSSSGSAPTSSRSSSTRSSVGVPSSSPSSGASRSTTSTETSSSSSTSRSSSTKLSSKSTPSDSSIRRPSLRSPNLSDVASKSDSSTASCSQSSSSSSSSMHKFSFWPDIETLDERNLITDFVRVLQLAQQRRLCMRDGIMLLEEPKVMSEEVDQITRQEATRLKDFLRARLEALTKKLSPLPENMHMLDNVWPTQIASIEQFDRSVAIVDPGSKSLNYKNDDAVDIRASQKRISADSEPVPQKRTRLVHIISGQSSSTNDSGSSLETKTSEARQSPPLEILRAERAVEIYNPPLVVSNSLNPAFDVDQLNRYMLQEHQNDSRNQIVKALRQFCARPDVLQLVSRLKATMPFFTCSSCLVGGRCERPEECKSLDANVIFSVFLKVVKEQDVSQNQQSVFEFLPWFLDWINAPRIMWVRALEALLPSIYGEIWDACMVLCQATTKTGQPSSALFNEALNYMQEDQKFYLGPFVKAMSEHEVALFDSPGWNEIRKAGFVDSYHSHELLKPLTTVSQLNFSHAVAIDLQNDSSLKERLSTLAVWNIKGVCKTQNIALLKHFFEVKSPDVVILLETQAGWAKIRQNKLLYDVIHRGGYNKAYSYWSKQIGKESADATAGILVMSKVRPLDVVCGVTESIDGNHDARVIKLEFADVVVLATLGSEFGSYVQSIRAHPSGKPLMWLGDLQVNPFDSDVDTGLWAVASTQKTDPLGCDAETRRRYHEAVMDMDGANLAEIFFAAPPKTCWTHRRGFGLRTDHIVVQKSLLNPNQPLFVASFEVAQECKCFSASYMHCPLVCVLDRSPAMTPPVVPSDRPSTEGMLFSVCGNLAEFVNGLCAALEKKEKVTWNLHEASCELAVQRRAQAENEKAWQSQFHGSDSKTLEYKTRLNETDLNLKDTQSKLLESEAKLQSNQSLIQQHAMKIEEAEHMLRGMDVKLAESQSRLRKSESQVDRYSALLKENVRKVQETEERLAESEAKLNKAKSQLEELEMVRAQCEEFKRKASVSETALAALTNAKNDVELQMNITEQQLKETQPRVGALEKRVRFLSDQATEREAEFAKLQADNKRKSKEVQDLEDELGGVRAMCSRLQSELRESSSRYAAVLKTKIRVLEDSGVRLAERIPAAPTAQQKNVASSETPSLARTPSISRTSSSGTKAASSSLKNTSSSSKSSTSTSSLSTSSSCSPSNAIASDSQRTTKRTNEGAESQPNVSQLTNV